MSQQSVLARTPFSASIQAGYAGGHGNQPFLYEAINEEIVSAEVLREEEGCQVVAVTYGKSFHSLL